MKIKPCTDDIISVFSIWPVIILCEMFISFTYNWNKYVMSGLLIMNGILGISSMRDIVYFARTIVLDCEGCAFSILGFKKRYKWSDLNMHLCENDNIQYSDSEARGPGLLIYPRNAKYFRRIAAMTYCRYFHPFSSLYIRFKALKKGRQIVTGKVVYYGYVVEKKVLLDYLSTIGIYTKEQDL